MPFFPTDKTTVSYKMMVTGTILLGVLFGFLFVVIIQAITTSIDLPSSKQATIFYDLRGREYSRIFVENRLDVPLASIPEPLVNGFIDVEDSRFYEHSGIDLRAIARAIWVDIRGGGYIEGGSTITQQLARNVLLSHKKALVRKLQEFFLALSIEQRYTKDEILERYLNQIYFGHNVYGVETAARFYFNKSVTELKLHQIALLIGIPKNPAGYSPYFNPQNALERRAVVLSQMVKYGTITPDQAHAAIAKPLDIIPLSPLKRRAAYFIDYIVQRLKGTIDEQELNTGGYRIYTTIDPLAQQAAEDAVATLIGGIPDKDKVLQPQIALVAVDPRNGYIKAMVGGRDFGNTQLNRTVDAYRQTGSAIKPFVYTAAIDSRLYTPSTVLVDEPVEFPTPQGRWKPRNYDGKFRGPITLRQALEDSINIIAVKLVQNLGPSRVIRYAKQMGLKNLVVTSEPSDLNFSSMALGGLTKGVTPLELTAAFTPLANQGIYAEPFAIISVKDVDGNTLFEDRPRKKVVLAEDTAYLVTDMLRGVIIRGTGQAAFINRPAAGKTGTSSDYTNAWFVGYTPDLVATVWIGNDSQKIPVKIENQIIGSGRAAQIWGLFANKALSQSPPLDFVQPPGIVTGIEVCVQSGELSTPDCPETRFENYLAGTEPTRNCPIHGDGAVGNKGFFPNIFGNPGPPENTPVPVKKKMITVRICTESGLVATTYCPANQVVTEVFTIGDEPTQPCNVHKKP